MSFTETPYVPDRLVGGDKKLVTREVTITENQAQGALTRGAVLGSVDGLTYARVHEIGGFPATTASAILAQDVDPSGGDVEALVYLEGQFNESEITLGGTVTADDVRFPLQGFGVHLRSPVTAAGAQL